MILWEYLIKYEKLGKSNFDTSGWGQRLEKEFAERAGGKFNIGKFKSLSINSAIPSNLKGEFNVAVGNITDSLFPSPWC
ncbi:hypothetical protein [Vibrio sp. MEBiC08052]|uniref:hypothetical protein n=1 Tax=Vibrio sp. MEBiC08052 TaxID=1761910 RepID=UPI000740605B|nr:hypothetical protein [Vibrio sp. MEBiC08052]KUI97639.1 hypothetical protein VRK_32020 [Vibrio sp. MEBiC08052]